MTELHGWDNWLDAFLDDLDAARLYMWWRTKNPKEDTEFRRFVNRLKDGDHGIEWPQLRTPFGRVLVRAAAACASHKGPRDEPG